MYFVLRRCVDKQLLSARHTTGAPVLTTTQLQEAKLFRMELEHVFVENQTEKVTTGQVCAPAGCEPIPPGLPGTWDFIPVELRLT